MTIESRSPTTPAQSNRGRARWGHTCPRSATEWECRRGGGNDVNIATPVQKWLKWILATFLEGVSMALRIDPEKNEVHALKAMTDWRNKRVIEIGCGNGRLTRRLAYLGAQIIAMDPDRKLIATARKDLPARLSDRVRFKVGSALDLKYPTQTFDIAVFSWVL